MKANFEANQSRRSQRMRLPAEVVVDGHTHAVHDWSFHGFSIDANEWHPEIGTRITPVIILPFDSFKAQIEVTALVRSVNGGNIGFEFIELPHAARVLMREYVEEFVHGKLGAAPIEVADSRFIEMPASNAPRLADGVAPQPSANRADAVTLAPKITRYLVLTALLVALPLAVMTVRRYVTSTSAVVSGNAVVLRAQVAGVISEIAAQPDQPVERGTVLVRIDDVDIRRRMNDLAAVVANRESMLVLSRGVADDQVKRGQVYSQVAGSRSVVDQRKVDAAKAAWQQAAAELKRGEELVLAGFISPSAVDGQRAAEAQRKAAWQQAVAESRLSDQLVPESQAGRFFGMDSVPNRHLEALRDVAVGEVELQRDKLAYSDLSDALKLHRAMAPVAGRVRMVSRAPGDWVKVGDPLAVLDTSDSPWVVATFDATDAQAMRPGQSARIYARASDTMFDAKVESIGMLADGGAAIAPLASEVAVRIRVDHMPEGVVAGMRLEVEVDTGRSPIAFLREWFKFWLR